SPVIGDLQQTLEGVGEETRGLGHTSQRLQDQVRRVRTVAVGRLLKRLARTAQDLAQKAEKPVRVVTIGEETEIERLLVERLIEPLLHLIRNALRHGIEGAEERAAGNKPSSGTLTLAASSDGEAVEILVKDDGRGVDVEAIRHTLVTSRRMS